MLKIARQYEKTHPSINIFLNREGKEYKEEGRYQTEQEAKELDSIIRNDLSNTGIFVKEFSFFSQNEILEYVLENIEK